ncbi:MAG: elongation factor Ts [Patescibacteria group bacterium]
MVTLDEIKELRDLTGVSIMQCQQALVAAGGDKAKALIELKKKSSAIADKKADRTLGSGVVGVYSHGGNIGAMVKLLCETDFVANNPEFRELASDIAMHVAAMAPEFVSDKMISEPLREELKSSFLAEVSGMQKPDEVKAKIVEGKLASYFGERTLLDQPFVKNGDMTVGQLIKSAIQKFGENIQVESISRIAVK